MLLAALIVVRFSSVKAALLGARATPFLLYCWVLVVLYAATFSSFANFGLLVRQRSLVLPPLFVLIAVEPLRRRVEPIDRSSAGRQLDRIRRPPAPRATTSRSSKSRSALALAARPCSWRRVASA